MKILLVWQVDWRLGVLLHNHNKAKDPPWYAVLREAWRVLLLQIYSFLCKYNNFLTLIGPR